MSPSTAGSTLAVPEPTKAGDEIASSQASYLSADPEKTDIENGDVTDIENEKREDIDLEAAENREPTPDVEIDESEYPTGAKLGFIVLALALSIFLMSLDFVCTRKKPLASSATSTNFARLSWRLPFPRSQMSSTVLTTWLGMAQPFS